MPYGIRHSGQFAIVLAVPVAWLIAGLSAPVLLLMVLGSGLTVVVFNVSQPALRRSWTRIV